MACEPCEIQNCADCVLFTSLNFSGHYCNQCEGGHFLDTTETICAPCSQGCSSCSGPDMTDCTGCHDGLLELPRDSPLMGLCVSATECGYKGMN